MLPDRLLIDARWYVAEDTIRPSAPQRATEPYELLKRLCTEYGVNCHRAYRAVAEGRTLAQGLAAEDRRRLVDIHLRPVLRRLFPRDPGRVEAELAWLLRD